MSLCDEIRAHLPLFVGADLEVPLAARVEEHLGRAGSGGGCPDCARALGELQRAREALLGLAQVSPAVQIDVWSTVRSVLAAEGRLVSGVPERPARATRPVLRFPSLRRWVSAAAAVALVALGVQQMLRDDAPGAPLTGPAVVVEEPAVGTQIAEQGPSALEGLVLPASSGGLRRLGPQDVPLYTEALPILDGPQGWPVGRPGMGLSGSRIDPSRPTFASDRSLR